MLNAIVAKTTKGVLVLCFIGVFSLFTHIANWVNMWQDYYQLTQDGSMSFTMVMDPELACQLCEETTTKEQSPTEVQNVFKKDILYSQELNTPFVWNNPNGWQESRSGYKFLVKTKPAVPPPKSF